MRIQTLKRLVMLSVLGALTAISANAQFDYQFRVTIPFNFSVGSKTLPAGKYKVGRIWQSGAVVLHETFGKNRVVALAQNVEKLDIQKQSKVVFRRYGDQYFLAEVWNSSWGSGRELLKSHKERSLARQLAKHGGAPERVAVVTTNGNESGKVLRVKLRDNQR